MESLQDRYAPAGRCFGCGPANEKGLRIKSYVDGDDVVASFTPQEHHEAFPNVLNGGIIGTLLDCHSLWTATYRLMTKLSLDKPPCLVTSDFHVKLRRPTPLVLVKLRARMVEATDARCVIEALLEAEGKVTATCHGTFIAVNEGHPAYHRW